MNNSIQPLANLTCPRCGGDNQCAPANTGHFNGECWCTKVSISAEALAKIPPDSINKACLCPSCAVEAQEHLKHDL